MLEYIAVAMVVLGIYLLIKGLTEESRAHHSFPEREMWEREPEFEDLYERESVEREWGEDEKKVEVKGGGVVLIGPIPIVFGDSKYAVYALILSIVLMLLAIALMVRV
ncbi:TIGR00304 family protein [Geoglobus ahangari]|uniref:TIGR00304 family protein n=1 Tax=Geoglobus ahangari TaxID=113653 RepID=A0A0F7IJR9_9EURY|nr:TIGR00304 family protein [Geoglobus ahangari]AKG92488.1 TIGR00304 family protein [Geoglobus ahangari]